MNFSEMTDSELFSFFSDYYKSCYNFRPSSSEIWTRENVIIWLTREFQPDMIEFRKEQWAKEEQDFEDYNDYLDEMEDLTKYEMMAEDTKYF